MSFGSDEYPIKEKLALLDLKGEGGGEESIFFTWYSNANCKDGI